MVASCNRPTTSKQKWIQTVSGNWLATSSQLTTNRLATSSQLTTDRLATSSQLTANRPATNSQLTTNRRATNSQLTTDRQTRSQLITYWQANVEIDQCHVASSNQPIRFSSTPLPQDGVSSCTHPSVAYRHILPAFTDWLRLHHRFFRARIRTF